MPTPNENESETPRTDAILATVQGGRTIDGADSISHEEDYTDKLNRLCRTLEHELTAANNEIVELKERLVNRENGAWVSKRLIKCESLEAERDQLQSRIAELEGQLKKSIELTEHVNELLRNERRMYEKASSERDSLRTQLSALEKDKERLDWIQNCYEWQLRPTPEEWLCGTQSSIPNLRAAIDSAIESQKKES